MIEFLYTSRYTLDSKSNVDNLTVHAELYAIADKYDIALLASEARLRYYRATLMLRDHEAFLNSIHSIYDLTPGTNRGLRDVAIACARRHREELMQGEKIPALFKSVCHDIPAFSADMLESFMQRPLLSHCRNCGPDQPVEALRLRCLHCSEWGAYNR
jgi:hypothetical protein